MTKLNLDFSTREYVNSHGRAPKGRGRWAFAEILCSGKLDIDRAIFVPDTMTLSEAKRWVRLFLAAQEVTGDFTLAILP